MGHMLGRNRIPKRNKEVDWKGYIGHEHALSVSKAVRFRHHARLFLYWLELHSTMGCTAQILCSHADVGYICIFVSDCCEKLSQHGLCCCSSSPSHPLEFARVYNFPSSDPLPSTTPTKVGHRWQHCYVLHSDHVVTLPMHGHTFWGRI